VTSVTDKGDGGGFDASIIPMMKEKDQIDDDVGPGPNG
jgi:hypothetical protein